MESSSTVKIINVNSSGLYKWVKYSLKANAYFPRYSNNGPRVLTVSVASSFSLNIHSAAFTNPSALAASAFQGGHLDHLVHQPKRSHLPTSSCVQLLLQSD